MHLGERVTALAALGARDVLAISSDSRSVEPGTLFFAVPGWQSDGAQHAEAAVRAGAIAVVSEAEPRQLSVPWLRVKDVRAVLADACRSFFARDLSPMRYAGVTGTNGKTTITFLFEQMARAAGVRCGLLGTIEQRFENQRWPATHTTLLPIELCGRLQEMETLGAQWAVLEVSSHALDQKRADALRFSVSGFTNLTPDHLDYHGTMDAYFVAKARLFRELTSGMSVIHTGGAGGERMLAEVTGEKLTVARDAGDVYVKRAHVERDRTPLTLHTPQGPLELISPLIGDFNVENVLVAVGMGIAAGFSLDAIARGIEKVRVPGRLQAVRAPNGRLAFVDYAHTPDALARTLSTLQALPHARVLCVFGCGGDRDKAKRPLMGEAVAAHSDVAVVTSDNPRSEAPEAIIADILPGLSAFERRTARAPVVSRSVVVLPDRGEAIRWAADKMSPQDLLLVAGKGHENYQIVGDERRHFDDCESLEAAFGGAA